MSEIPEGLKRRETKEEWLARMRSIGVLSKGRTKDKVTEERLPDGSRTKTVTDQLGNDVTEHTKRGTGVSHRQDVMIRPETLRTHIAVQQ